jgi:hypothetical protein
VLFAWAVFFCLSPPFARQRKAFPDLSGQISRFFEKFSKNRFTFSLFIRYYNREHFLSAVYPDKNTIVYACDPFPTC